jgi:DNA-binding CsgD family transcriptional regulator
MPEIGGSAAHAAGDDAWKAAVAGLQDRVTQLTRAQAVYLSALEAVPLPLLLLDASHAPLFVHRRAQAVLQLDDGLTLTSAGLVGHDREGMASIRNGITEAIQMRRRSSLLVPRRSGRSAFVIVIAPLDITPPLDPGVAAILLIDPDASPGIDEAGLRSLYGLTRAEANLVSILARGRTLEEAADELCVSLSTVRTHLQRVFLKTDTARQAQLLRRLLLGHVQLD